MSDVVYFFSSLCSLLAKGPHGSEFVIIEICDEAWVTPQNRIMDRISMAFLKWLLDTHKMSMFNDVS